MIKKRCTTIVLALLAAAMHSFAQHGLGYTLKTGQTFTIKQKGTQEMVMEIENNKQVITNDIEAVFDFTVTQKEGDVYTISFQFVDFALKSSSNLQGVLMDVRASKPVEGNMMSTIFSGLLGATLQMQMKTNGKILLVSGTDSMIDRMLKTVGDIDEFSLDLMRKSLDNEFSSENLSSSFEQMTYIYPDKPVSVGGVWNTEFKGKVGAQNEWTLEKIENGTIAISGRAAITMTTQDTNLNMSLSGSQETLAQTSQTTGFVQKMMVRGSGEGTSTMAMAPGVEIPTTLSQTISYELIE